MNMHEPFCNNICFLIRSHHDQQFRTGLRSIRNGKGVFLPANVSNPHFMPRYNSSANLMFLMTLDCYISSFTNITGYIMSLTQTLFINAYATVIIIHVFLFALHSSSILHNFLCLVMMTEVQVTFANIYTSDSLYH
jgi:hypothetical protein